MEDIPSTSRVDSVNHIEPEEEIDLYLCDGWRETKLATINKRQCQDLAGLAQEFSVVWEGNWKTIKDFVDRDLPIKLGTVRVFQPWPALKANFLSKKCNGEWRKLEFSKESSDQYDTYGRYDEN